MIPILSTEQALRMNHYFTSCADIAKALSHPHRLALLTLMSHEGVPVEYLASTCALSFANASQHLQQLKRMGLVQVRRDGKRILYSLSEGPVSELLKALIAFVDHRQEQVHRLASGSDASDAITLGELSERMRDGSVVLLDVRPGQEFAAGHLPGAVNVELDALEAWLKTLPQHSSVIAYCRGAMCMLSADAVAMLRAHGHAAQRLLGGMPEMAVAQGLTTHG